MPQFEFSFHARDMLAEREILQEWVLSTLRTSQCTVGPDGNLHYTMPIEERGDRVLHVVVNPNVQPNRVVTVFFDRRLKRTK